MYVLASAIAVGRRSVWCAKSGLDDPDMLCDNEAKIWDSTSIARRRMERRLSRSLSPGADNDTYFGLTGVPEVTSRYADDSEVLGALRFF